MAIPSAVMARTLKDMATFAAYWNEEIPVRLHSRETSDGGTPEWHHEFRKWMTGADDFNDRRWRENPEPRLKTTRAFRKLRKFAPREYEVVYRTVVLQIPFRVTVAWLNERAIRNGKDDRYTEEDALMLLVVGIDKIAHWFSA